MLVESENGILSREEILEALREVMDPEIPVLSVVDLGIIGAGTRVEHYEMAGYMTAISLAQRIGEKEVAQLLGQSLAEEQAAEAKLRQLASTLLKSSAMDQQAHRASA